MELYWALKKNEIMLFAGKGMELENIVLSKVSQAQKVKGHMFSLIYGSYTCMLNVYIHTYIKSYIYAYIWSYIYTYIYSYIHSEREIVLVSLRGLQETAEGKKMLENEKYFNI
jgi:hypothetical protein